MISEQDVAVEDEVATADDDIGSRWDVAKLCTACSALVDATASRCGPCGSSALRVVRSSSREGGDRWMPRLARGPRRCEASNQARRERRRHRHFAVPALPPSELGLAQSLPGDGENSLAFSDSRQAAAYFAPYLENSYDLPVSATDEPACLMPMLTKRLRSPLTGCSERSGR